MFGIDDALLGGLVAGGGALLGGLFQSNSVSDASDKSVAAQTQALQTARADVAPWVGAGTAALNPLLALSGAAGPDAAKTAMAGYQTSPGYQWQLSEGLRAVDAGAAAKGMLRSGATLKAEQAYGAGLADSDFANYYNRLFDLSKLGANAATNNATNTVSTGQGTAQTLASSGLADANITGGIVSGVTGAVNSYNNNQLLTKLLARQNPLLTTAPSFYGADNPNWPGYGSSTGAQSMPPSY